MTLHLPENLEKRLAAVAQARGVPTDTLIETVIEEFLTAQPRRNAKGFVIPSFAGSVESQDSSWIDGHEDILRNAEGLEFLELLPG